MDIVAIIHGKTVDSHQLGCKSSQGDHSSAEIHLHQFEHCCHLPAEPGKL
jgi:hypothetical protein